MYSREIDPIGPNVDFISVVLANNSFRIHKKVTDAIP